MNDNGKKLYIYLPVIFAFVFIAGMFSGIKLFRNNNSNDYKNNKFLLFNKYDKLNDAINFIQKSYVDSVSKEKLAEDAINSLLEKLDPHSVYISASEFNEANDPLIGSFEGIGVEFRIQKDTITVMNVIPGGPSEKIGILAGDRIVKVDGKNVAGIKISNKDVMRKLKGKRGSKVTVYIYRRGVKKLFEYTITRNVIPIHSLDISYMLTKEIGYIKFSKFSATTYDEFVEALEILKNKGMKKLVMDLRNNGGGYMQAAIDMADEFLEKDKLIVYTKGMHKPKSEIYATSKGNFEKNSLVILIDEFSASASEIVAGAIQDNDRAPVIGRRSFGKGLVQEQIKLYDGSAIRLTVARYYTPTGRCIQRPYTYGTEEYYTQFYEQFFDGKLENSDSIKFADSLKFKTPKGKIVYGGGGIMPDVFIPLNKEENSKYFITLFNKGLILQFAFDYADKNRQHIKINYNNAQSFIKNFSIDDALINNFFIYAEKNGVKKDEKNIALSALNIKTYLKAYIGKNIFDDAAFYPVIHQTDYTLKKAVSVLDTLK